MAKSARKSTQTKNVNITGLEELFTNTVDPARTNLEPTEDQVWTLTEAANAYNVTERTIRRWIKEQVLSAWKVAGPRGPEWRIDPGSTVEQNGVQPGSISGSTPDLEPIAVSDQETPSSEIERLWKLLQEKDAKIEALVMRTGYLQGQLESKEEQIKLLTDSQHKPNWWQKLRSWVTKSKTQ